jgi:hypothetical protein
MSSISSNRRFSFMSKRHIAAVVLGLTAAGGATAYAVAGNAATQKTYTFKAGLDTRQETAPVADATNASGAFTGTLTIKGKRGVLAWKLSFRNLSGRPVAARVHYGATGKTGPFVIPLCAPCKIGAHGAYFGTFTSNSPLLKALLHSGTYANVETKRNPKGEIRGQIKATG